MPWSALVPREQSGRTLGPSHQVSGTWACSQILSPTMLWSVHANVLGKLRGRLKSLRGCARTQVLLANSHDKRFVSSHTTGSHCHHQLKGCRRAWDRAQAPVNKKRELMWTLMYLVCAWCSAGRSLIPPCFTITLWTMAQVLRGVSLLRLWKRIANGVCCSFAETRPEAQATIVTFNTLMSACAKAGMYSKVGYLYKALRERGFTPDIFTLSALIQACKQQNFWEEAIELTETFERMYQVKLNTVTCNALMTTLGQAGRWQYVMQVVSWHLIQHFPLDTSDRIFETEICFIWVSVSTYTLMSPLFLQSISVKAHEKICCPLEFLRMRKMRLVLVDLAGERKLYLAKRHVSGSYLAEWLGA